MYLFSRGSCPEWSGNDLPAEPEQTKVKHWSIVIVTPDSSETTWWLECQRVVGARSVAGVYVRYSQKPQSLLATWKILPSLCRVCFSATTLVRSRGSNYKFSVLSMNIYTLLSWHGNLLANFKVHGFINQSQNLLWQASHMRTAICWAAVLKQLKLFRFGCVNTTLTINIFNYLTLESPICGCSSVRGTRDLPDTGSNQAGGITATYWNKLSYVWIQLYHLFDVGGIWLGSNHGPPRALCRTSVLA